MISTRCFHTNCTAPKMNYLILMKMEAFTAPIRRGNLSFEPTGKGGRLTCLGNMFYQQIDTKKRKIYREIWGELSHTHRTHTQPGRQAWTTVLELLLSWFAVSNRIDPSIVCISSETETMRATTKASRHTHSHTHTEINIVWYMVSLGWPWSWLCERATRNVCSTLIRWQIAKAVNISCGCRVEREILCIFVGGTLRERI